MLPGEGIEQDIDEGIIPWVSTPSYMAATPGDGTQFLDTSLSGWTDYHYGLQMNTVGGIVGINPRVETHVIMINSAGLVNA